MDQIPGKDIISENGGLSPVTETGRRLIELRKARGSTQKEIAQIIGVDLSSYSAWEIGAFRKNGGLRRHPVELKQKHIAALADLYGVSADYIIGRSPYKSIDGAALADLTGLSDTALNVLQRCAHDPRLAICSTVSAALDEYANAYKNGGAGVLAWLGSYAALSPDISVSDADAGISVPPFLPDSADRNMLAYTFNELKKAANQFRQKYGGTLSKEGETDAETVSN